MARHALPLVFLSRLPRPCRSKDSSLVYISTYQNSRWQHKCCLRGKHSLNQPITSTQYCLHHTIRYGNSANPTPAYSTVFPLTSCWLDVCFFFFVVVVVFLKEWLDWYFSCKAFPMWTKTKNTWALETMEKSGDIFNGHCCDSKASSSHLFVIIQVLLCKTSCTFFYTNLVILHVHEFAVILSNQQGKSHGK